MLNPPRVEVDPFPRNPLSHIVIPRVRSPNRLTGSPGVRVRGDPVDSRHPSWETFEKDRVDCRHHDAAISKPWIRNPNSQIQSLRKEHQVLRS